MVQLATPIDLQDVKPAEPFVALPPGDYPLEVVDSELCTTRAGNGRYIKYGFRVDSGTGKGRRIWMNYNIENPNAQAVEIAQRQLKSLCEACGHRGNLDDTEQLHGHVFMATLKVRKSEGYDPQNEIADYKPIGSRPGADPLQDAADYASAKGKPRDHKRAPSWA